MQLKSASTSPSPASGAAATAPDAAAAPSAPPGPPSLQGWLPLPVSLEILFVDLVLTTLSSLLLGSQARQSDMRNANPANIRNHSSESAPHPSMLIDPGIEAPAFFTTIIIGQPVGVIHNFSFFMELIRHQSEIWFMLTNNFNEALGYYRAQYNNGNVRVTPLSNQPLDSLLHLDLGSPAEEAIDLGSSTEEAIMVHSTDPTPVPRRVLPRNRPRDAPVIALVPVPDVPDRNPRSLAQPEIDPALSAPSPLSEVAAARTIHSHAIPISSSGSEDGSDNEFDSSGQNADTKGKQRAVVVDQKEDPRLQHIPSYPKALPRPSSFVAPQVPSAFDAPYPFHSTPPTSSPVTSLKRIERPSDENSAEEGPSSNAVINKDLSAKKRRHDTIHLAFSKSMSSESRNNKAVDYSGLFAAGAPRSSPAPWSVPRDHAGQLTTASFDDDSDTEWLGLVDFSHEELDSVGDILGPPAATTSQATASPAPSSPSPSASVTTRKTRTSRKRTAGANK
ncbi:hypothetical protein CPB84DRAFT_1856814 [Gymnopilus junonius]|uniref:Uncharacterized protein n=1 Tax=Gymnopilus junonius TaxID=109634 RepID=A0A9P5N7X5_GYMJU|nr:hypothetical protein CPB84DRAFT_1856814 [Gymnopilus junonius]